jgi:hypothetical protein
METEFIGIQVLTDKKANLEHLELGHTDKQQGINEYGKIQG